jgi:hypothetical protein
MNQECNIIVFLLLGTIGLLLFLVMKVKSEGFVTRTNDELDQCGVLTTTVTKLYPGICDQMFQSPDNQRCKNVFLSTVTNENDTKNDDVRFVSNKLWDVFGGYNQWCSDSATNKQTFIDYIKSYPEVCLADQVRDIVATSPTYTKCLWNPCPTDKTRDLTASSTTYGQCVWKPCLTGQSRDFTTTCMTNTSFPVVNLSPAGSTLTRIGTSLSFNNLASARSAYLCQGTKTLRFTVPAFTATSFPYNPDYDNGYNSATIYGAYMDIMFVNSSNSSNYYSCKFYTIYYTRGTQTNQYHSFFFYRNTELISSIGTSWKPGYPTYFITPGVNGVIDIRFVCNGSNSVTMSTLKDVDYGTWKNSITVSGLDLGSSYYVYVSKIDSNWGSSIPLWTTTGLSISIPTFRLNSISLTP